MRTLCDGCDCDPAAFFCPADAALCRACDQMVHMCDNLASRHIRLGLESPSDVARCGICEVSSGTLSPSDVTRCGICEVSSGVKRTHARFLLLRQRIQFPEKLHIFEATASQTTYQAEKSSEQTLSLPLILAGQRQNHKVLPVPKVAASSSGQTRKVKKMIDLNRKPRNRKPPQKIKVRSWCPKEMGLLQS
ncbi:hypothetical protein Pint_28414 [Pistacia integerrima]|uniref:Uncharacterized protein n=1 Tax=Pistacia integerrima TaxID=434235 RepID=A0ACC0YQE5_9ROSI|nr:hypothetical protein Pint_28414 [Pistacia integerrima]